MLGLASSRLGLECGRSEPRCSPGGVIALLHDFGRGACMDTLHPERCASCSATLQDQNLCPTTHDLRSIMQCMLPCCARQHAPFQGHMIAAQWQSQCLSAQSSALSAGAQPTSTPSTPAGWALEEPLAVAPCPCRPESSKPVPVLFRLPPCGETPSLSAAPKFSSPCVAGRASAPRQHQVSKCVSCKGS